MNEPLEGFPFQMLLEDSRQEKIASAIEKEPSLPLVRGKGTAPHLDNHSEEP